MKNTKSGAFNDKQNNPANDVKTNHKKLDKTNSVHRSLFDADKKNRDFLVSYASISSIRFCGSRI